MKYRLIEAVKAEHSISPLCKVLGVTRADYHAWSRRGPSLRQRHPSGGRGRTRLGCQARSGGEEEKGVVCGARARSSGRPAGVSPALGDARVPGSEVPGGGRDRARRGGV
jgi:hypothetical protein